MTAAEVAHRVLKDFLNIAAAPAAAIVGFAKVVYAVRSRVGKIPEYYKAGDVNELYFLRDGLGASQELASSLEEALGKLPSMQLLLVRGESHRAGRLRRPLRRERRRIDGTRWRSSGREVSTKFFGHWTGREVAHYEPAVFDSSDQTSIPPHPGASPDPHPVAPLFRREQFALALGRKQARHPARSRVAPWTTSGPLSRHRRGACWPPRASVSVCRIRRRTSEPER